MFENNHNYIFNIPLHFFLIAICLIFIITLVYLVININNLYIIVWFKVPITIHCHLFAYNYMVLSILI